MTPRAIAILVLAVVGCAGVAGVQAPAAAKTRKQELTTKEIRLAFIRKAQIWVPTNVAETDLRAGPGGPEVVKVRYGAKNGEVQGAALASRLLWALGFAADAVYSVRVTCRGCPSDPWKEHPRVAGEHVFDPAVIERKPKGQEITIEDGGGWAWPELDLVD